jgi:uncharacterized membrane protein YhaH (DUF805 family)
LYWGINLYNYDTLQALNMSGVVLGWTILSAVVLLGFAAFTTVVFRRTMDKTVTGSYSVMLLIALIGYTYLAFKAPKVDGNCHIPILICSFRDDQR